MILRPATLDDVEPLARLGKTSFVAKFGHLYGAEDLNAFLDETFSNRALAAELADPDRAYQLAEIDGALAGYCKIGVGSSYAQHSTGQHLCEIKQLYTDPGLTGRGIGAQLMKWALAELRYRGADTILLTVFSENHGAQHFYERFGFAKIADIHFWVGNHRDDEFLYELKL